MYISLHTTKMVTCVFNRFPVWNGTSESCGNKWNTIHNPDFSVMILRGMSDGLSFRIIFLLEYPRLEPFTITAKLCVQHSSSSAGHSFFRHFHDFRLDFLQWIFSFPSNSDYYSILTKPFVIGFLDRNSIHISELHLCGEVASTPVCTLLHFTWFNFAKFTPHFFRLFWHNRYRCYRYIYLEERKRDQPTSKLNWSNC